MMILLTRKKKLDFRQKTETVTKDTFSFFFSTRYCNLHQGKLLRKLSRCFSYGIPNQQARFTNHLIAAVAVWDGHSTRHLNQ